MKKLIKTAYWFKILRSFSRGDLDKFLKMISEYEKKYELDNYKNALKATALLRIGQHDAAKKIYLRLSLLDGENDNDKYIALFSIARLHGFEGNDTAVEKTESQAKCVECSWYIKRNLLIE